MWNELKEQSAKIILTPSLSNSNFWLVDWAATNPKHLYLTKTLHIAPLKGKKQNMYPE